MSKNKWTRIIAAAFICFMLISFTACGNSSKKEDSATASAESSTSSSEQTTAVQQDSAIDSAIIGEWEYENGGYTYNFKEDGSGTYDTGGTVMKFTYTADGSKVSITYEGNTAPLVLNYEINGNKLSVKDSNGNDTFYIKK
ncbi:MAG: hypothetical protein IKE65_05380 [Clostridia bacterium]|nr:hypothetical protein [Clostridia bacterium]